MAFFAAAEAEKDLAAHEMNILVVGDQLFRGIEGGEGFAIFSLALVEAAQSQQGNRLEGIVMEGFAEKVLGLLVFLLLRVQQTKLFVIVGKIWLDGHVFAEFGFGAFVVFLPHIGETKTKVYVRQIGVGGGGEFQFGDGFV